LSWGAGIHAGNTEDFPRRWSGVSHSPVSIEVRMDNTLWSDIAMDETPLHLLGNLQCFRMYSMLPSSMSWNFIISILIDIYVFLGIFENSSSNLIIG